MDKDDKAFLNVMCGVGINEHPSSTQLEEAREFSAKLVKLRLRVMEESGGEPLNSMIITGIVLRDYHVIGQGAHADIYLGEYQGKTVAVKKLRTIMDQSREEQKLISKVGSFGVLAQSS